MDEITPAALGRIAKGRARARRRVWNLLPQGVPNLGFLEARHCAHARVEDRIRIAKDTGLGRLPSREFTINQVWVQIAAIAADLTCWLQLLALHDSPDLVRAEPKTLRFRMLHVPAQLHRGARQRRLRIPASWPWAAQITRCV